MEIVPTSAPKNNNGLDELIRRKSQLKAQIVEQKSIVIFSTQRLLSPSSITSNLLGYFTKGMSIVNGVKIGFRIMKSLTRLFRGY